MWEAKKDVDRKWDGGKLRGILSEGGTGGGKRANEDRKFGYWERCC
jgi:hypothetical protein